MMHHPEQAAMSDPARHYFVPSIPSGLADETICHYCRRPANEHRQRASSGGSTAPAETAPSSESMENQCWGSVVTGCHPGVPREVMTWPDEVAYLAELDALPRADVPDEPRGLCWDCRRLYRDGPGPQAAALRSEYARRTSAQGPDPRHPVDCHALDMGRR